MKEKRLVGEMEYPLSDVSSNTIYFVNTNCGYDLTAQFVPIYKQERKPRTMQKPKMRTGRYNRRWISGSSLQYQILFPR